MWTITDYSNPVPQKGHDRLLVQKRSDGYLVGIFDGHGRSTDIAEYCVKAFSQMPDSNDPAEFTWLLHSTYHAVAVQALQCEGGTTATVARLWDSGEVCAALLGDSPFIAHVRPEDPNIVAGPIHNVGSNETERAEAVQRGAFFDGSHIRESSTGGWRHEIARSFENARFRPFISQIPDLCRVRISKGGWAAFTSDGVLNSLRQTFAKDITAFCAMIEQEWELKDMVGLFQAQIKDDASLIVCRYA